MGLKILRYFTLVNFLYRVIFLCFFIKNVDTPFICFYSFFALAYTLNDTCYQFILCHRIHHHPAHVEPSVPMTYSNLELHSRQNYTSNSFLKSLLDLTCIDILVCTPLDIHMNYLKISLIYTAICFSMFQTFAKRLAFNIYMFFFL